VADLVGAFDDYKSELVKHGHSCDDFPDFTNKEELTMFADYRVPQILRHLGMFTYSEELAALIDTETELGFSSVWEVEIRAATIVAVDMIMAAIRDKGSDGLKSQVKRAYEVDWLLWQMGE